MNDVSGILKQYKADSKSRLIQNGDLGAKQLNKVFEQELAKIVASGEAN